MIEELENGCFMIDRTPVKEGGLRIPRQEVCPFVQNWPKLDEVAEAIDSLASSRIRVTSGALVPVFGRA